MAKFEPQLVTTDSLLRPELIFFGSGYVSKRSLEAVGKVFAIEAVISKSPTGVHASQSTTQTQQYAAEHGLDFFTADTKTDLIELFSRQHFRSQMGLVVDYGVIIPEDVINFFPLGIANSHFSLLPKYRGADPIRAAIINRDDTTGISAMLITPKLDDGPVIARIDLKLDQTETTQDLTDKLLEFQTDWLPNVLLKYHNGQISPEPQNESEATYTTKLSKADGKIDWSEPAETIEAKIRAYAGWPKAQATIGDFDVVLHNAELTDRPSLDTPGTIHTESNSLLVDTSTNQLEIKKLQLPGKSPISAADFINGYLSA